MSMKIQDFTKDKKEQAGFILWLCGYKEDITFSEGCVSAKNFTEERIVYLNHFDLENPCFLNKVPVYIPKEEFYTFDPRLGLLKLRRSPTSPTIFESHGSKSDGLESGTMIFENHEPPRPSIIFENSINIEKKELNCQFELFLEKIKKN